MFENSVLLYAKYFVSGCLCQLLISKLEKKNLSAAEKDMIVKVQYKLCSYQTGFVQVMEDLESHGIEIIVCSGKVMGS